MTTRPEPVDVLATLEGTGNFLIAKGASPADVVALHEARAALAELIAAAGAVAGPQVGINPRDRKLHALRAALANVSGGAA